MSEPQFVIRPPPLSRAAVVLLTGNCILLGLWTVGCIIAVVPACILISGGVLGTLIWVLRRRPRLAVVANDDELLVRNWVGGLTIHRAEIAEFRIVTPSVGTALRTNSVVGPAVHVVKRDGTLVPLKPTAMKFPDQSLEGNLTLLSEWLSNGQEHSG